MEGFKVKASNIMLGNNQVKQLYLGSNKLWDSEEDHTYALYPLVMDSIATLRVIWNIVTPDNMQLVTTGNSTFVIRPTTDIKMSDIQVTYSQNVYTLQHGSSSSPRVVVNKIDDFGLYIHRFCGYNVWPGGNSSADYDYTYKFTYFDHEKTIRFYGLVDENNKTYMNGLYVNKVIKCPSKGSSGIVKVQFFPYTFEDEFYCMNSFPLYLVDYNDESNSHKNLYLWDNDNKTFTHTTTGNIINLNDTIFSSFNVTYEGLLGTIEYTIKPNYTNEFRDAMFCTSDAGLHFIQEPHNDHRIYIGEFTRRILVPEYLDSYEHENEYIFHLCGSKIVNNVFEHTICYTTDILYPKSFENEFNIIMEGNYTYVGSYMWDNIQYEHYSFPRNSKIIFDKK